MENTLADQAARREQVAGRPVTARHHRLAIPAQLPSDVATFTGRTQYLADLGKLPPSHEPARDKHHRATAVVISAIDGTAGAARPPWLCTERIGSATGCRTVSCT